MLIHIAPRWRRWLLMGGIATVLIALALLLLPTIICNSALRGLLLRQALAKARLTGDCTRLRVSWFSPFVLDGLKLSAKNGTTFCEIESLRSRLTLWDLIRGQRDLGSFDIHGSTLHLFVGEGAATWDLLRELERDDSGEKPHTVSDVKSPMAMEIHLRNARLVVHEYAENKSLADVGNVDLDAVMAVVGNEPQLTLTLLKPLAKMPVTADLCRVALRFATPVLAVATWTKGTVTLELEKCVIPMRSPQLVTAAGTLILHDVEAGLQDELVRAATHELASLTGRELPRSIKLAQEDRVDFQIQDARISHSGLAVGLPNVSSDLLVRSAGSVGFDESVDIELQVPLPFALLGKGALAQTLGNQTLHMPVTGTLKEPHISFQGDGRVVSDLLAGLLGSGTKSGGTEEAGQERDSIDEVLEQAGNVAEILRQRFEERRKQREADDGTDTARPRRPLRDLLDRFR